MLSGGKTILILAPDDRLISWVARRLKVCPPQNGFRPGRENRTDFTLQGIRLFLRCNANAFRSYARHHVHVGGKIFVCGSQKHIPLFDENTTIVPLAAGPALHHVDGRVTNEVRNE